MGHAVCSAVGVAPKVSKIAIYLGNPGLDVAEGTTVGVMNPQGKIVKRSTRKRK